MSDTVPPIDPHADPHIGPPVLLLYVTAPDIDAAEALGDALIEARLAACVNILPGVRARYRWEGKIETAQECVMIVKTTKANAGAARDLIVERHPYETPAVLALPTDAAHSNAAFAQWIREETDSD